MKRKKLLTENCVTISNPPYPIPAARVCGGLPEMMELSALKPSCRNARNHSKKQLRLLSNSMKRFKVIVPLVIDADNNIVAGHARAEAAKLLGLEYVPVIRVAHLSKTELRAYMLADNQIAAKAGWDRELLAIELRELQIELPAVGLDLEITGFEPAETDSILMDFADAPRSPAEEIPDLQAKAVTKEGDVYRLGTHRLVVGDARHEHAFKALMGAEIADMAFLDPPYNVKIQGHVGGRGNVKHPEFTVASGEMTPDQYVQFLQATLTLCALYTRDGGINYVCMDWRHCRELLTAGLLVYDELKNICVWVKTTPGQGTFYRSQHELVFIYKKGLAQHINTFELGQHGRTRSNVWTYPGANGFRPGRIEDLKMHPTVKPLALVADAMRDCSKRGSIVLDAFCGSGTTIIAAEQIGRRAFCMEIDPHYADVTIRRWQKSCGKDAILESTGQVFDDLPDSRQSGR